MDPGQVVQPNSDDQQPTQVPAPPTPPADPPPPTPPPAEPPTTPPPGPVEPPTGQVGAPAEAAPAEQLLANNVATPQQEKASSNPARSDQPQPTQNPDEPPADPPDDPVVPHTPPPPPSPPDAPNVSNDGSSFSWEASEYVEHDRTMLWYIVLGAVTLALVVFSILVLKEWLSALVVVLMAVAIGVYARRKPGVLKYQLSDSGVKIGEKVYPYDEFRSFA